MAKDHETFMAQMRLTFEEYLQDQPAMAAGPLREAMAYSLLSGGKRLRPLLFLLTADLYGQDVKPLLPFAAAIEMIHTYSLIHDDLPAMDNDDFRRGRPTCHKQFGEGLAILAGDGLLTESFHLQASLRGQVDDDRLLWAIRTVAALAGTDGMVLGQSDDILGEGRVLTLPELQTIHRRKTGALITLSLQSGAILAGAGQADVELLAAYGYALGAAFQITDDILDVEGSFEELGKPIGSDVAQQKTTYVSLLGVEGARAQAEEAVQAAKEAAAALSVDAVILDFLAESVLTRKK